MENRRRSGRRLARRCSRRPERARSMIPRTQSLRRRSRSLRAREKLGNGNSSDGVSSSCSLLAASSFIALLKINHVDVKVLADNRRDSSSAKPESDANKTENGLSAEAINIAREAMGTDHSDNVHPSLHQARPSPSPDIRYAGFTDNRLRILTTGQPPTSEAQDNNEQSVAEASESKTFEHRSH